MIFSLVLMLGMAFSSLAQNTGTVKEQLTEGKWINHQDGYIPNALGDESRGTVKRYKIFEFQADKTFTMDSIKQRFTGHWTIEANKVIMTFNKKNVQHLSKNRNPNSNTGSYWISTENLDLGTRVAQISDDVLKFGDNVEFNCAHESDAVVGLKNFYEFTGFANVTAGHLLMMLIGIFFLFLAIKYDYEPLLLIPIGTGILIGNIPMFQAVDFNLKLGVYEPGSVMNLLYSGVLQGWYPPLIFLGIGAMTDFSSLISNPRLMILGAAAQIGIFATFLGALWLGFAPPEAGAIGIIGGADGPTAIFLSSKLANGMNVMANGETVKNLIGPIAIAAYSYMALVPVIQPPIINLLTTKKERMIKMKAPRAVTRLEKIMFPVIGLLLTAYISPTAVPLLGMLFFGNLLKESTVTNRLAETASNALINVITIC